MPTKTFEQIEREQSKHKDGEIRRHQNIIQSTQPAPNHLNVSKQRNPKPMIICLHSLNILQPIDLKNHFTLMPLPRLSKT